MTLYDLPSGSAAEPEGIAVGADGDLYVAEYGADQIAKINPNAVSPGTSNGITEYPAGGAPLELAAATDGGVWATEPQSDAVVRFDPQSDTVTSTLAGAQGLGGGPTGIADDGNGHVWFTEFHAPAIGADRALGWRHHDDRLGAGAGQHAAAVHHRDATGRPAARSYQAAPGRPDGRRCSARRGLRPQVRPGADPRPDDAGRRHRWDAHAPRLPARGDDLLHRHGRQRERNRAEQRSGGHHAGHEAGPGCAPRAPRPAGADNRQRAGSRRHQHLHPRELAGLPLQLPVRLVCRARTELAALGRDEGRDPRIAEDRRRGAERLPRLCGHGLDSAGSTPALSNRYWVVEPDLGWRSTRSRSPRRSRRARSRPGARPTRPPTTSPTTGWCSPGAEHDPDDADHRAPCSGPRDRRPGVRQHAVPDRGQRGAADDAAPPTRVRGCCLRGRSRPTFRCRHKLAAGRRAGTEPGNDGQADKDGAYEFTLPVNWTQGDVTFEAQVDPSASALPQCVACTIARRSALCTSAPSTSTRSRRSSSIRWR